MVDDGRLRHDELSLPTRPFERHHRRSSDVCRDRGTEISSNQVQAQIQSRRRPRRRQHGTVIDVEHIRIDGHSRESLSQHLRDGPMRGRRAPVERARLREHKRSRANRGHPRASLHGAPKRRNDLCRDHTVQVIEAGHDDRVGATEHREA